METEVKQALDTLYETMLPMATTLAAVGVATMAMLQLVKDILPVRRFFVRRWLWTWLDGQLRMGNVSARWLDLVGYAPKSAPKGDDESSWRRPTLQTKSWASMIDLTTAGDEAALFRLGPDKVIRRLSGALKLALAYPLAHRPLLLALCARNPRVQDELETLLRLTHKATGGQAGTAMAAPSPAATSTDAATVDPSAGGGPVGPGADDEPSAGLLALSKDERDVLEEAQEQVAFWASHTLDAAGLRMTGAWQLFLHSASVLISAGFIFAGFALYLDLAKLSFGGAVAYTIAALIGGFVAPVARDLVAALRKLR